MKRLKIQYDHAQILFEMSTQVHYNIINVDDMVIIVIKVVISTNNV